MAQNSSSVFLASARAPSHAAGSSTPLSCMATPCPVVVELHGRPLERERREVHYLLLEVVRLVADEELPVRQFLRVPELAQKEGVVAHGHLRLEGGPLLLVVRTELPALEVLALRVPVARVLPVLVVLL